MSIHIHTYPPYPSISAHICRTTIRMILIMMAVPIVNDADGGHDRDDDDGDEDGDEDEDEDDDEDDDDDDDDGGGGGDDDDDAAGRPERHAQK